MEEFMKSLDKREGKVVVCTAYKTCEAPKLECWHRDPHLFDRCRERLDCEWCGTVCKCVIYYPLYSVKGEG